ALPSLHDLQARLVSFQLGLARLAAFLCLPGQAPPLLPGHGLATRGPAVVTSQLDHRTHADAALAVRPPDGASICRLVAIACLAPAIPDVKARLAELGLYPCSDRPPDVAVIRGDIGQQFLKVSQRQGNAVSH